MADHTNFEELGRYVYARGDNLVIVMRSLDDFVTTKCVPLIVDDIPVDVDTWLAAKDQVQYVEVDPG